MRKRAIVLCGLTAAAVFGCAGKPSVTQQYAKKQQEIIEKYDAMIVADDAPLAGAHSSTCGEFVDKLKAKYTFWKPGDAGAQLCASRPKGVKLRDFELKVRAANNQAVERAKTRRLARLKELYQEALKTEGTDESQVKAENAKKQKLRDKEQAAQEKSAEANEPADATQFDFLQNPEPSPVERPSLNAPGAKAAPAAGADADTDAALDSTASSSASTATSSTPKATTRPALRGTARPLSGRPTPASKPAPSESGQPAQVDPNDPDQLPYSPDEPAPAPPPRPAPVSRARPRPARPNVDEEQPPADAQPVYPPEPKEVVPGMEYE